jgi:hypothetical protein
MSAFVDPESEMRIGGGAVGIYGDLPWARNSSFVGKVFIVELGAALLPLVD